MTFTLLNRALNYAFSVGVIFATERQKLLLAERVEQNLTYFINSIQLWMNYST